MPKTPVVQSCLTVLATITGCGLCWAAAIPASLSPGIVLPPQNQTHLTWQADVALRSVDGVKSFHLVEGYLYAIGADSTVRCVRADTGRLLWSKQLPAGTVYPPVAYRSKDFYAVAFTLTDQVILLDPETGSEFKRLTLSSPACASCSTAPGFIFVPEAGRRLRAYELKDNLPAWQILTDGPMAIPPLYQPDLQTLILVDESGLVAMVWGSDKEQVYARKLDGTPQGWIATDADNIYLATSDNLVNCLNRISGETIWQYRLPARPEGGPVVYGGDVYQAVAPQGIQRISIGRDQPNWFDPDAVQFLSMWDGRPALLHRDGRIAVIDPATGKSATFINVGPAISAISNTANESLLMISAKDEIRCLQPAGANPAVLASFRPTTTQPATQPAGGESTNRPVLARKPKAAEETLEWSRSFGQAGTASATPRERSSGRERSSRSSSRGDRSSRSGSRGSSRSSRSGSSRGERSSRRSGGGGMLMPGGFGMGRR